MPNRLLPLAFTVALSLALVACGRSADTPPEAGSTAEHETEQTEERGGALNSLRQARNAVSAMNEMTNQMRERENLRIETVDFRQLRDLLPERLDGRERTDASGERTGMAGFTVSRAEGTYHADPDDRNEQLTVKLIDIGGAGNFAFLGAAWLMAEVDRESSSGFERTTTFEGHRAYEKEERRGDRLTSELQVVVENRFLVSLEGRGVEAAALRRAASGLDFRAMQRLHAETSERIE